jgi:hypothetical protein
MIKDSPAKSRRGKRRQPLTTEITLAIAFAETFATLAASGTALAAWKTMSHMLTGVYSAAAAIGLAAPAHAMTFSRIFGRLTHKLD